MKTPFAAALISTSLIFGGLALAAPAMASPIDGVWQTQEVGGTVQIYECGAALCGKVLTSARIKANPNVADDKNHDESLRSRLLKGMVIMTGFTGGPPDWKDGSIYNPEDGGTYRGSIHMSDPDTLKLKGCWAFICKTQTWKKLP